MKNLRGYLYVVFIFFSCKSSTPKDILPPQKMQAILWDVMQADEMADYYSSKDSTFKDLSRHVDFYQKIFAIHNITKLDFKKSLNYYQNHPARLKPIFDSLQRFAQNLQSIDSFKKKPDIPINKDSSKRKLHVSIRPK